MHIKVTPKALWTPGWYELDQSLIVGQRQRFWFFAKPPVDDNQPVVDYVFFNQMAASANSQIRYAKVLDIEHPELGPLQRVDTEGLDYIFYPVDGTEFVVNAEENPGLIYGEEELVIDDWSVIVTLADVSSPLAEVC